MRCEQRDDPVGKAEGRGRTPKPSATYQPPTATEGGDSIMPPPTNGWEWTLRLGAVASILALPVAALALVVAVAAIVLTVV